MPCPRLVSPCFRPSIFPWVLGSLLPGTARSAAFWSRHARYAGFTAQGRGCARAAACSSRGTRSTRPWSSGTNCLAPTRWEGVLGVSRENHKLPDKLALLKAQRFVWRLDCTAPRCSGQRHNPCSRKCCCAWGYQNFEAQSNWVSRCKYSSLNPIQSAHMLPLGKDHTQTCPQHLQSCQAGKGCMKEMKSCWFHQEDRVP